MSKNRATRHCRRHCENLWGLASEVLAYAAEEVKSLNEAEQGIVMGALVFEILSSLPPGTQARHATKLKMLDNLSETRFAASGPGSRVFAKVMVFMNRLRTTKMCFIAGTMVMSAQGAVFDADYFQKFGKNPVYHGSKGGPDSLANRLGAIRRRLDRGEISTQQMVNQVNDLYTNPPFADLNLWPITRDWLRQHGTASDVIIPD